MSNFPGDAGDDGVGRQKNRFRMREGVLLDEVAGLRGKVSNTQVGGDPLKGVAFSCWGALSLLSALGLRYPLRMVPLLLFQLTYKLIWLLAVWLPQNSTIQAAALTKVMVIGLLVDLVVIPWSYVWTNYVKSRGDRWRS